MPTYDIPLIKAQLDRVLASKPFQRSPVLANFLRYIVIETIEHKTSEIKEYSIAVKALGKAPDFNPQIDAVIRIHARRLRRCLLDYYEEEGANDTLIISLNKGSYVPEFGDKESLDKLKIAQNGINKAKILPVNRVAVWPFKNLSGRNEIDFMIDGFGEQLSSDLAQFQEIAVVSYYSTSKFRNEKPDIREIGEALNISHLITGSIYRDENTSRISMQLVNTITGTQLWAQSYDRTLQSNTLHEVFDDIIKQIVPKLVGYYGIISRSMAFSTQLEPFIDQKTADAVFWYYHYQIIYTEEIFQMARTRIEKALQDNPYYALGWGILGQMYIDGISNCYFTVEDPLKEANRCVEKALQLNPDCQHAYVSLSWMSVFYRDKKKAIEAIEYGVAINPRSPFVIAAACFLHGVLGEYDRSMDYFNKLSELNPYYSWWVNVGPILNYFYKGEYAEALKYAERINIPGVFWNYSFKIAALGQLSQTKEASALAEKFDNEFPGKAAKTCEITKAVLFHEVVHERIKEGFLKAGLAV